MFSCEFCEIFKNTFSILHFRMSAPVKGKFKELQPSSFKFSMFRLQLHRVIVNMTIFFIFPCSQN